MIVEALAAALKDRRYVWLRGPRFTLMGYVVQLSSSLILFRRFRDFAENGFAVVRIDCLEGVTADEPAIAFFGSMLEREGLKKDLEPTFSVDLDSMRSALGSVRTQHLAVLLDRGEREAPDEEYVVGELIDVDDLHTRVRFLTAHGTWEDEVSVATAQIVRAEFGTPYLLALKKYAK